MILIIDNYDSFTYNLAQAAGQVAPKLPLRVIRNDRIDPAAAEALRPTHIIISPGPCTPAESGTSPSIIRHFAGKIPILGVCLGHQCIAEVAGASVVRAQRIMHGKTDRIYHHATGLYAGIPTPFVAARYHSLIVAGDSVSGDFLITSWTARNEIMGIRHKSWPLEGMQFHPESFMTEHGEKLIANFLRQ